MMLEGHVEKCLQKLPVRYRTLPSHSLNQNQSQSACEDHSSEDHNIGCCGQDRHKLARTHDPSYNTGQSEDSCLCNSNDSNLLQWWSTPNLTAEYVEWIFQLCMAYNTIHPLQILTKLTLKVESIFTLGQGCFDACSLAMPVKRSLPKFCSLRVAGIIDASSSQGCCSGVAAFNNANEAR